jgi:hypothetical protein
MMGFFTRIIDSIVGDSLKRARERDAKRLGPEVASPITAAFHEGVDEVQRSFVIHKALNGQYIEMTSFKYNAHGPNTHTKQIYLVPEGSSLIESISLLLVIGDK